MLRFSLLILAALSVAGAANATPLHGRWSGQVHQADGQRYPMILNLRARSGDVSYPSLKCAGRLVLVRQWSQSAIYRERILRGAAATPRSEGCVDGGLVRVRLQGARLAWQWTSPEGETDLNARAVLSR